MDRSRIRRIRALVWRPILGAAIFAARFIPWRTLQGLGRALGGLAWRVSKVNRERSLAHLEIAFPELSSDARSQLGRRAVQQQMMNVLEYFHLAAGGPAAADRHLEVVGWEHYERARESDRPIVIVTGHCGNWELIGAAFSIRKAPLAAVVRSLTDKEFEPMLERLREAFGTQTINRGEPGAARSLLGALRSRTALLMLIDQDIRTESVFVPFFGRPAHTPVGAARLAIKRSAVTLPIFMERREDGSHLMTVSAPFELPDDPTVATALFTQAIERQVREHPEQWVWWHRRWRRKPGEPMV